MCWTVSQDFVAYGCITREEHLLPSLSTRYPISLYIWLQTLLSHCLYLFHSEPYPLISFIGYDFRKIKFYFWVETKVMFCFLNFSSEPKVTDFKSKNSSKRHLFVNLVKWSFNFNLIGCTFSLTCYECTARLCLIFFRSGWNENWVRQK